MSTITIQTPIATARIKVSRETLEFPEYLQRYVWLMSIDGKEHVMPQITLSTRARAKEACRTFAARMGINVYKYKDVE